MLVVTYRAASQLVLSREGDQLAVNYVGKPVQRHFAGKARNQLSLDVLEEFVLRNDLEAVGACDPVSLEGELSPLEQKVCSSAKVKLSPLQWWPLYSDDQLNKGKSRGPPPVRSLYVYGNNCTGNWKVIERAGRHGLPAE